MTVNEFLRASVGRCPEKIALVAEGTRLTYAQVEDRVSRLAAHLRASGVQAGDRVMFLLPNGPEAVVAVFATLRLGAVVVPVNPQVKAGKLEYLLRDCRPAALILYGPLLGQWLPALGRYRGGLRALLMVGAQARGGSSPTSLDPQPRAFEEALQGTAALGEPDEIIIDADLAAIIYTSGSTGDAKGVMLSHLNMVAAARSVLAYLPMGEDDVILCALPLSFGYGLYQVLMGFWLGATVVLEVSFAFPIKVVQTMVRERATVFPGVPTMFSMLLGLKNLATDDLNSLRLITNAGAALTEAQIQEIRSRFPQAAFYSMYGLTECKRVSYLPPAELDRRPTSVGRGMPNQEIFLVDEAGERLPPGSTGELVVRGSHVMRGYWGKPEETRERLRPGAFPGDVQLHTGDIFRQDQEGFLFFVGRKDDLIKSRGERISPLEVESALLELPGVRQAAVIGVPDPVLGQAVKAFLVLDEGVMLTEAQILRHCRDRLENYMVPKLVVFSSELPMTPNGKIRRAALRELS